MRKSLFICHTLYHVYISILKAYKTHQGADCLLWQDIPEVGSLRNRLLAERLFGQVLLLDDEHIMDGRSSVSDYWKVRLNPATFDKLLGFVKDYDDVYVFNDRKVIGYYLNNERIKYHLIEDGFDCYKLFNQYKPRGRFPFLKRCMHACLGIPISMAQGKQIIDVEVNDIQDLETDIKFPVIEISRSKLYEIPSKEQIVQLFRIFDADALNRLEPGSAIILTSPLWELGIVSSREKNVELFARIADALGTEGCYVKPHPRDDSDYSAAFPASRILSSTMPIELLNYLGDGLLSVAATWCSTAIYGLSACSRRIVFDPNNQDSRIEHMMLKGYGDR